MVTSTWFVFHPQIPNPLLLESSILPSSPAALPKFSLHRTTKVQNARALLDSCVVLVLVGGAPTKILRASLSNRSLPHTRLVCVGPKLPPSWHLHSSTAASTALAFSSFSSASAATPARFLARAPLVRPEQQRHSYYSYRRPKRNAQALNRSDERRPNRGAETRAQGEVQAHEAAAAGALRIVSAGGPKDVRSSAAWLTSACDSTAGDAGEFEMRRPALPPRARAAAAAAGARIAHSAEYHDSAAGPREYHAARACPALPTATRSPAYDCCRPPSLAAPIGRSLPVTPA